MASVSRSPSSVTPEEALESATLSDNKRRWSVQGEGAVQLPEQTPWCPDIFSMDGLKVAKEKYGFHGSTPHLLTYNATKMRPLMMPFIPMHRDLTVCHSSKSWFIYLGYIGYSLFIMVILGTQAYSETEYGEESACKNPAKNTDFCQLEPVLSRAVSDFRFLISFILAGFVAANVNKWIQRRSNYASLCGTARNLGITAAAVLTSSDNDTASAAAFKAEKRRIGRYIILAFELSVLKARGHMDTDHGRQYLEDIELLLPGEWERMAPGDRHSSVFYWILSISKQLCDDMSRSIGDDTGSSTQSNLQIIAACVGSMRAQANDMMSCLDRDEPISYMVLCGLLVRVNVILASTWKGVEWSAWMASLGPKVFETPKLWIDLITLFAWNCSYAALYDLCYTLDNPFGPRRIDVAHETIGAGIRRLVTRVMDGHLEPPPPVAVGEPRKKDF